MNTVRRALVALAVVGGITATASPAFGLAAPPMHPGHHHRLGHVECRRIPGLPHIVCEWVKPGRGNGIYWPG